MLLSAGSVVFDPGTWFRGAALSLIPFAVAVCSLLQGAERTSGNRGIGVSDTG